MDRQHHTVSHFLLSIQIEVLILVLCLLWSRSKAIALKPAADTEADRMPQPEHSSMNKGIVSAPNHQPSFANQIVDTGLNCTAHHRQLRHVSAVGPNDSMKSGQKNGKNHCQPHCIDCQNCYVRPLCHTFSPSS